VLEWQQTMSKIVTRPEHDREKSFLCFQSQFNNSSSNLKFKNPKNCMLDKEGIRVGRKTLIKMLPYALLGLAVFSFNSTLDAPYIVRGYSTLMEFQVGFLILYFLSQKRSAAKK
jgi:hypothetical protein